MWTPKEPLFERLKAYYSLKNGLKAKKVEVRGIEPRSEMVYRSSIYMLSYRIRFHLKRRSVTNNSRLFCLEFTQHPTDGGMLRYSVIVDVATALTDKKPRQRQSCFTQLSGKSNCCQLHICMMVFYETHRSNSACSLRFYSLRRIHYTPKM